jgi:hypothetical protein
MASITTTLVANTPAVIPLDAPTGRIVITQIGGTAAVVYATVDGSFPTIPGAGEIPTTQRSLPAVAGGQVVLQPPLFGDHMVIPTVRLQSAGTPTVLVEW